MSSSLTTSLERLNQAISKLENAIDTRITRLETQQRDLFAQLDVERDRTKSIASELDSVISQIEKTLHTSVN